MAFIKFLVGAILVAGSILFALALITDASTVAFATGSEVRAIIAGVIAFLVFLVGVYLMFLVHER